MGFGRGSAMANSLSISRVDRSSSQASSEDFESKSSSDTESLNHGQPTAVNVPTPHLFHKIKNQRSILALLVSDSKLYTGTQSGDLLVWSLETYELLSKVHAHRGSVLCLSLSADKKLLFSSAGDAIVNVWCTTNLVLLYSIYSKYDVGDVFSVVYSSAQHTVYLGAQNTSIQWYNLSRKDTRPPPDLASHPSVRNHRFFDSKGPTGLSTPRPPSASGSSAVGGQHLEIDKDHIVQYAHYGYVYCMLLAKGLGDDSDAETLISGGGDGSIKLWSLSNIGDGGPKKPVSFENGDESVLALALDDTLLYSGRLEGAIDIWDLDTCQLIRTVKAHTTDTLTIAVGHGLIFSGAANGFAKILNSRHENISKWGAHDHLILASCVTAFSGHELYVTGGNDGCIAIWDISKCIDRPAKASIMSNEQLVQSLQKLVSYRTISSKTDYAEDCRRGASYLRTLFKQFGAVTELFNTGNDSNPIVFARFRSRDQRHTTGKTILFYGHYDVVAADNWEKRWDANPFEMQGNNGFLYGRGVSDNKGPLLAALYAVADLAAGRGLSSDIVFLIEGEEESGSRGFQKAVKEHKNSIGDVDWILLANSYWLNDDIPCLTYGLRGVVRATVEVSSKRPDLHSGVDGSRLVSEALKDLIALLAGLTGANGEVTIPGFYNNIPPMTAAERDNYLAISEMLVQHSPELGDAKGLAVSFKARWRQPSLTIHRVKNSGPTNMTIISRVASADLSIRLVPDQTTAVIQQTLQAALLKSFEKLDSSNELTIKFENHAEPWIGNPSNEIFRTLEKAVIEVWGLSGKNRRKSVAGIGESTKGFANGMRSPKMDPATSSTLSKIPTSPIAETRTFSRNSSPSPQRPLYIREGGSIPAVRFLEQEFDAPAAHLPCGQASDGAHLDNERLRLLNLYNSRKIFKKVFQELPFK